MLRDWLAPCKNWQVFKSFYTIAVFSLLSFPSTIPVCWLKSSFLIQTFVSSLSRHCFHRNFNQHGCKKSYPEVEIFEHLMLGVKGILNIDSSLIWFPEVKTKLVWVGVWLKINNNNRITFGISCCRAQRSLVMVVKYINTSLLRG